MRSCAEKNTSTLAAPSFSCLYCCVFKKKQKQSDVNVRFVRVIKIIASHFASLFSSLCPHRSKFRTEVRMSEPTPTANDGEDENGTAVAAAPAAEDVSPPKVVEEEKIDELEEVRLPIEEEEEEEKRNGEEEPEDKDEDEDKGDESDSEGGAQIARRRRKRRALELDEDDYDLLEDNQVTGFKRKEKKKRLQKKSAAAVGEDDDDDDDEKEDQQKKEQEQEEKEKDTKKDEVAGADEEAGGEKEQQQQQDDAEEEKRRAAAAERRSSIQTTRTPKKRWQISSCAMKVKNAKRTKNALEGKRIIVHNAREVELGTTKFVRLPTFSETFQTYKNCSPTGSDRETKATWVERVYQRTSWKKKVKVNTKPTMKMWTILSSMTRKEEKDHPAKRRCVKFASSRSERRE